MKTGGAVTILRWGLAFVFFYGAIAALINPSEWAGFIPGYVSTIIPIHIFLTVFSLYELALAALLFSGRKLYWSSLFATITLAAILVVNFNIMDIVFRDVGLLFAALALFEIARSDAQASRNESAE